MNGIINVYKEAGYTSFDVVAIVRGITKIKKIGHTGTLDPDATGVLPVCIGNGTKLVPLMEDHEKEYIAEILLGVRTDTQDMSGEILEERPVEADEQEVRAACMSFVGAYQQIPPMYSAVKVNGKRLYDMARAGKEVERKPRMVHILELEILSVDLPRVKIRVVCSKGTYIRTLCSDIGEKLGCLAAMQSLVRTRVGSFCIDEAVTIKQLEGYRDEGRLEEVLLPTDRVFADLPAVHVKEDMVRFLANGNTFYPDALIDPPYLKDGARVRMYGSGRFYGVYEFHKKDCRLKPFKMFL